MSILKPEFIQINDKHFITFYFNFYSNFFLHTDVRYVYDTLLQAFNFQV